MIQVWIYVILSFLNNIFFPYPLLETAMVSSYQVRFSFCFNPSYAPYQTFKTTIQIIFCVTSIKVTRSVIFLAEFAAYLLPMKLDFCNMFSVILSFVASITGDFCSHLMLTIIIMFIFCLVFDAATILSIFCLSFFLICC